MIDVATVIWSFQNQTKNWEVVTSMVRAHPTSQDICLIYISLSSRWFFFSTLQTSCSHKRRSVKSDHETPKGRFKTSQINRNHWNIHPKCVFIRIGASKKNISCNGKPPMRQALKLQESTLEKSLLSLKIGAAKNQHQQTPSIHKQPYLV